MRPQFLNSLISCLRNQKNVVSASSQQGNKYGDRFNHQLLAKHTELKAKLVLLTVTDSSAVLQVFLALKWEVYLLHQEEGRNVHSLGFRILVYQSLGVYLSQKALKKKMEFNPIQQVIYWIPTMCKACIMKNSIKLYSVLFLESTRKFTK